MANEIYRTRRSNQLILFANLTYYLTIFAVMSFHNHISEDKSNYQDSALNHKNIDIVQTYVASTNDSLKYDKSNHVLGSNIILSVEGESSKASEYSKPTELVRPLSTALPVGSLLLEGDGIDIEGSKIINTDKGSSQSIFKEIVVDNIAILNASTNDDRIELYSGEGIKLVTNGKALTINSLPIPPQDTGLNFENGIISTLESTKLAIGNVNSNSLFSVGTDSQFSVDNSGNVASNTLQVNQLSTASLVIKQNSEVSSSSKLQEWKNKDNKTLSYIDAEGKLILPDNSLIVGNQLSVIDNKIGIGTTFPNSNLDVFDPSSPKIRLSRNSDTYFNIQKRSSTGTQLQDVQQSGDALIDFDPIPSDGSSKSLFRFFRNVTTTGITAFSIYKGDGTATINSFLSGNTNSYINAAGGFVGIGTSSPKHTLHVNGTIAPVSPQQSLGTSSLRWNIFATNGEFTGKVKATEGVATKVVNNSNGKGCSDSDFTNPSDGTLCIDQKNGRIYYRYGGTWHYSAQTGGFQIPNDEKFLYQLDTKEFDKNIPLKEGDLLLPFVEAELPDGSLHGLYTRFNDVIEQVISDYIKEKTGILERLKALESITPISEKGTEFIEPGDIKIRVSKEWEKAPSIIILTSDYNTNIWYEDVNNTGFTIYVEKTPSVKGRVNWLAEW